MCFFNIHPQAAPSNAEIQEKNMFVGKGGPKCLDCWLGTARSIHIDAA